MTSSLLNIELNILIRDWHCHSFTGWLFADFNLALGRAEMHWHAVDMLGGILGAVKGTLRNLAWLEGIFRLTASHCKRRSGHWPWWPAGAYGRWCPDQGWISLWQKTDQISHGLLGAILPNRVYTCVNRSIFELRKKANFLWSGPCRRLWHRAACAV